MGRKGGTERGGIDEKPDPAGMEGAEDELAADWAGAGAGAGAGVGAATGGALLLTGAVGAGEGAVTAGAAGDEGRGALLRGGRGERGGRGGGG